MPVPRAPACPWLRAALLCALVPGAAQAQTVTRGPYLQDVRADRATLVWATDRPAGATVRLRPGDGGPERTLTLPAGDTHSEAVVTGLSPGLRYTYSVVVDGAPPRGGSVRTAPGPGPGHPFSFIVYGDNRSLHDAHRRVVEAIRRQPVDLLVSTGNLVADGARAADWQTFFDIEGPLLRDVPLFAALGNHDVSSGDASAFTRHLAPPRDSSGREEYYAFTWGNARFAVLDGEVCVRRPPGGGEPDFDDAQKAWLDAELARTRADGSLEHLFVVLHRGPYTSTPGREGNGAMRRLLPTLERHRVTALFSGHDHYYERGATPAGTPYFIVGGGGAPLYETRGPRAVAEPEHTVVVSQSTLSFARFDVDGPSVRMTAFAADGARLDSLTFRTRPADSQRKRPSRTSTDRPDSSTRSPAAGSR